MNPRPNRDHSPSAFACARSDRARARHAARGRLAASAARGRGFTVVELVVVIALAAVLSVVALSRLTATDLFTQRAAADELAAAMRQAQKRAVAQRGGVSFSVDTAARVVRFCRDALPGCPNPMTEPGEASAMVFRAPTGATLALTPSSPSTLSIDGLGRVSGATGATTDLVLDSSAAQATVRIWTQTGLTEVIWSPR